MQQDNTQGSSPTLKVKSKILPLALVLTFLAFGSLSFAWYKTYYALPEVLPTPLYSANATSNEPLDPNLPIPSDEPIAPIPTDQLIDINDYAAIDPVTGWTIYTNETVGYQISYPSDWLVDRELGSKGYYDDGVRITFNDLKNNTSSFSSVNITPVGPGLDDQKSNYDFYNEIKELNIGQIYVYSVDFLEVSNDVVRLKSWDQISNIPVFLVISSEGSGTEFFAYTTFFYPKIKAGTSLIQVSTSVPPPESPYFNERFFNISTNEKYQESLQILQSFKLL